MSIKKGIKLKVAISLLAVFIVCSTTIVNWYLSVHALKDTLTENYLQNNYRYATKVSLSTSDLFFNMQQNLGTLAKILGSKEYSQEDLDYWKEANANFFNSIFITDETGVVQLMTPKALPNKGGVKPGVRITSDLMIQALKDQKPFVSNPYMAQTGNLVVLISYPIFDQTGTYQGVVDGTVYLESDNSLQRILNQHEFLDQSSVFVVDQNGRIIYHPNSSRLNESIADHPLIQKVIQGKSGSAEIINRKGQEYFSGYAYVEQTGWGIIAQTPTTVIEQPLRELTKKIIIRSLPLLLLIYLLAWLFTNHLAKPINRLASYSEEATQTNKLGYSIHQLEIKSPIHEVKQLYKHLHNHFQLLNKQIQQDGLTGIANRRAFDLEINDLITQKTPFSLIMLDIDNFKKVNDEQGHLVGDDVLRFIASIMEEVSRKEDLCYRYGGEEFAILLKTKEVEDAYALAERLRLRLSSTVSPAGYPITISLGISTYQKKDPFPEDIIKRADSALYQSKRTGKNKTTIYELS
ncbi:sensor domain-containing diguanylate cyclase [Niallia endozanthoxylica]|uniref:Diguanylate cyclase n=1 Tax=Niallia endozanthoxylica TaxID=2036016 RepID=A0A5J5H702_9BACI|nr:sensor domain-containing diguanylate cyclase [Niallia endozanthoxylica]KAA9015492.1 diguanylate cyclase [Niallia endozanthoxylica]